MSKSPETLRSIDFEFFVTDCPYGNGNKRTWVALFLKDPNGDVAAEIPVMAFNKVDPTGQALLGGINAAAEKKLKKFGFNSVPGSTPESVLHLVSPPLPKGLVVKAQKVFSDDGFGALYAHGKADSKVKGHSTEDDFDGDGKKKHKP